MDDFLLGPGFLGTKGTLGPDLSLVLSLLAAALLTVGWRLAAGGRYEVHRWVQTSAVIVNAVPVAIWMVRSFVQYVVPGLPGNLSRGSYTLTSVHAVVGAVGMVMGVYLVLRGREIMREGGRGGDFKRVMRFAYALYMAGTVLGVVLYAVLFG